MRLVHLYQPTHALIFCKLLILLVPQEGFEPPTHALRMRCSTPELLRLSCSRSPDLPAALLGWTRPCASTLGLQAARHSLHYVPTGRQLADSLPDPIGAV